ncbi:hypothetical protein Rsub_13320 [Raphidocelis subcapitata]|uniref:glucose-6-phosphate dehydrogenase (NADP(+)) n=1 Tax=Raphidocelis subcapitata TaxID=307507 RepID=A0A2V0PLG1_9CHLO|nr:hypothetical protein Rsub_13320 [Raphidocelis subcapitata]|eukprot:GBG00612.1 hypothetical protein Rsub_13320 [Raphidocelis subcapitata]
MASPNGGAATAFAEAASKPPPPVRTGTSETGRRPSLTGQPGSPLSARAASIRDCFDCRIPPHIALSICVLGASGDLARKKTYPALYALYAKGFLPPNLQARCCSCDMSDAQLRDQLRPFLKGAAPKIESFLELCTYIHGEYAPGSPGYTKLADACRAHEGPGRQSPFGRLFYLALPPFVYPQVCEGLKGACSETEEGSDPRSWVRLIVEKPFGRDLASSEELAQQLGALFPEEQLYRIDQ